MGIIQTHRVIAIGTPLGDDVLLFKGMSALERLSRPFEYEIELLSEDPEIKFDDIVGQNVTVRLEQHDGQTRYFNGYVSRFAQTSQVGRLWQYRATAVPWLWFLTRMADCRIFQELSVPYIVKQVFRDHGFTDFDDRLSGSYKPREYCVQYRETDFNFVSRLMEQEGIYYYFEHENGKHTLILADCPTSHQPYPGFDKLPYRPSEHRGRERESVWDWVIQQLVQPGTYALNDFDFEKPKTALEAKSQIARQHAVADGEVYDYPGEYKERSDGDAYARVRIEELQAQHEVIQAQTDVRGVCTGRTFELTDHPRPDQGRKYLVTSTAYQLESDTYDTSGEPMGRGPMVSCSFTAMDLGEPFRPPRVTPKPVIQGPQTAIVCGKQGEELWTDKYGRVMVQFHWDRYSKGDEKSSCWIRVAQVWAGKKWGGIYIPRIGQEVIVEFLEGDPDRPIITGRVYNADCMAPYDLPAQATKSTLKSLSSKGGGGFNEFRFEDKKGDEQVFLHAEKNQDVRVKKDCFEWIGNNRHLIVKKDQLEQVENNRHETVKADHVEEIGKDRHLNVKGKEAKAVTGSLSLTVKGDVIEVFKANHSEQTTQNLYLKAMGIVIEAMQGITIKCSGNSVVLDPAGVTVTGKMVTIDGTLTKINSGPGSSPQSGQAGSAVAPTAPTAPAEADKADPGEMAEVKARQRQTQSGKYGSVQVKPFQPGQGAAAQGASWIEIELVGEDGKGIPGETYRIELADGSVAEGTLDDKGVARVEGIEKGNCKITFPNLDKEAWEKA